MDAGDIIFIGFLLFSIFGGTIVKLIKKSLSGFATPSTESNGNPMAKAATPRPSETFSQMDDEEPIEYTVEQDSPYFTYETIEPEVKVESKKRKKNVDNIFRQSPVFAQQATQGMSFKEPVAETVNPVMDEPFDLRKAIVYQTIMQNNYL